MTELSRTLANRPHAWHAEAHFLRTISLGRLAVFEKVELRARVTETATDTESGEAEAIKRIAVQ